MNCGRLLNRRPCDRTLSPFTPTLRRTGRVSDLEVLPPGWLIANPDLELTTGSRPHIKRLHRSSSRLVIQCACGAEHVIKYRDVMNALLAKLRAEPTLRRIVILTSEL